MAQLSNHVSCYLLSFSQSFPRINVGIEFFFPFITLLWYFFGKNVNNVLFCVYGSVHVTNKLTCAFMIVLDVDYSKAMLGHVALVHHACKPVINEFYVVFLSFKSLFHSTIQRNVGLAMIRRASIQEEFSN